MPPGGLITVAVLAVATCCVSVVAFDDLSAGSAVVGDAQFPDARFVTQPPIECPVMTVKSISTLFIHAGALTGEATALQSQIQHIVSDANRATPVPTAPGGAASQVTGVFGSSVFTTLASIPQARVLNQYDIVIYMDMVGAGVMSDLNACSAMGTSLAAWFSTRPGRDMIVDGRALSMTSGAAVTVAGLAELRSMWLQLAVRSGGLLILGHDGVHQTCSSRVMPQLGLLPLSPDTPAAAGSTPADISANERK